jgi:geranylgeranylglycerol-phosphate geranylgeranyltransferase
MLARELVKDGEDVEGDKASGAVTIPIRYGMKTTMFLALACVLLGIVVSLVPYLWWGSWYISGILLVDAIILFACIKTVRCTTPEGVKATGASALLKAGMFASLVIFTLSALFL